ncbi:hypothetical protein LQ757_18930 [Agromyces sp. SYSU K20354]|uniref:hypothetical protein n=1 Tax=Agromyces cavernae TaxID=2898659 RepID=UPI001E305B00|nr:hypothetical protein [Agromyces cavernae]MCD2444360.1 hypothetical protein [Agromyces cavernae]
MTQDVSRRKVLQGIAWSAPVIALAVPAPAYAASPAASLELALTQFSHDANTHTTVYDVIVTPRGTPTTDAIVVQFQVPGASSIDFEDIPGISGMTQVNLSGITITLASILVPVPVNISVGARITVVTRANASVQATATSPGFEPAVATAPLP